MRVNNISKANIQKMLRVASIIFLSIISFSAHAQVKLLSVDDLEKRIGNGKDTTYVINFWATWCAPCVEELPSFEKINSRKFGKPIKVLLVSLDFKSKLQKNVIPFVQKHQLQSEVFLLNETNQQKYIKRVEKKWSGSIPATLFINKEKRRFYEKSFTANSLQQVLADFGL